MSDESPASQPAAFSIVRIFVLLLIVAAVGGAGAGVAWLWNTEFGQPARASGRVTWKGNPVTIGVVMAQHQSDPTLGPIGKFDEDGRFELLTNMQPGIPVGTYKLKVASYSNGMPPQPLVPAAYTEFATTPLIVQVTGDPEKDFFEIELEGELPESSGGRPRPDSEESPADNTEAESPSVEDAADPGEGLPQNQ